MNRKNAPGKTSSPSHFGGLAGYKYASLATFRKNGSAVATPVWFAEKSGKLYITTIAGTGKVKRIRNNPLVMLAPCDVRGKPLGAAVEGRARMLSEKEEERYADGVLGGKYGFQYRAFGAARSVISRRSKRVFIEIHAPDPTDCRVE